MKAVTNNIYTLLNKPENIEMFKKLVSTNPNYTYNETTLEETLKLFNDLSSLLNKIIASNEFDLLPYNTRNNILTTLNTLVNNLTNAQSYGFNFGNGQFLNFANSVITTIGTLSSTIDSTKIYEMSFGFQDYKNQEEQLIAVRKRYDQLLKDVTEIGNLQGATRQLQISINDLYIKSAESANHIKTILDTANLQEGGINSDVAEIYGALQKVKEVEQDIADKQLKIVAFHNNIETYEKHYEKTSNELSAIFSDTKGKLISSFGDFDIQTKLIEKRNTELQVKVEELLQGANAGALFTSFDERKRQVETGMNWWLVGIILTAIAAIALSLYYIYLGEFALDARLIFKVLIILPLIGLEFLFINQFNRVKELVEEYAFKAAISLTFLNYKKLVEDNKDNKESMDFIISTIAKIYESPIAKKEIKTTKTEAVKIPEKVSDKLIEFALKQMDKAIGGDKEKVGK